MNSQSSIRQRLLVLVLLCALSTSLVLQARTLVSIASLRTRQLDVARELADWSDRAERLQSDLGRFPASGPQDPGSPVQQAARVLDAIANASDQGVHWDSLRFVQDTRARATSMALPSANATSTVPGVNRGAAPEFLRERARDGTRDNARNLADLFHPLALSPTVATLPVVLGGQYLGIEGLCAHIAHLRSLGAAIVDLSLDGNRVEVGLAVLARTQS